MSGGRLRPSGGVRASATQIRSKNIDKLINTVDYRSVLTVEVTFLSPRFREGLLRARISYT